MDILLIALIAVAACIAAVTLKQWQPNMALVVSAVAGIMITVYIITKFAPYISAISQMTNLGTGSVYIETLLKVIGICAVAGIASDICRDAGQNSLASRVDIGGRLCVIAVSLPLFSELLEEAANIIKG